MLKAAGAESYDRREEAGGEKAAEGRGIKQRKEMGVGKEKENGDIPHK